MNTAYRLILIVLFGVLMTTCQKEVSLDNGPVGPGPGTTPVTITASVTGRIINELGDPVQGATVKTGNAFTTTDINGAFKLVDVQMVDKAAFVTVTKAGYFDGSRTFMARQGHKHFVEIQLIPKIEVGSINGNSGGTITLGNGSAITLPANGIVIESSGAVYTGAVKVSMAWIDPTSQDLFRQMPGDLRGTDATNTEVGMESYGMIGVELKSTSGEKLQIASGKKATLKFPLPSSIQGTAPATIALWSFDETKGLWKQEGTATKTGSSYTAEVSHFSWWNCDIPISTPAYFTATFVDQNGQPLKGYHVSVFRANNQYSGAHGYTDTTGFITGRVPANEPLVLKVNGMYPCQALLHTQNVGPFAANATTNLGTVTITLSSTYLVTITGSANNCAASPVTNGYVEVSTGNFGTYRQTLVNGNFSISFLKCTPGLITYYVVDKTTNQQSAPLSLNATPGNHNVGTISACGVSANEFLNFNYDGQSFSITDPNKVAALNNQGSAMLWINGYDSSGGSGIGNNASFFINNNNATGNFPLGNISGRVNNLSFQYTAGAASNILVTITADGGPGGFIEGSFSGAVTDTSSVSHTMQCSFRARRQ